MIRMKDLIKNNYAKLLVSRLERISADSIWAHKVSGIRGSLLKILEIPYEELSINDTKRLDDLVITASEYLEQTCIELF